MKYSHVSLALLFAVISSVLFQFSLLILADRAGGAELVGAVSLELSIANLLAALCLSDLKSQSMRRLVDDHSLTPLLKIRNSFLFSLLILVLILFAFSDKILLAQLIILRTCTQAADVNVSTWQINRRAAAIFSFSVLRYLGVTAVLFGVYEVTKSFHHSMNIGALFAVAILVVEQTVIRRAFNQLGLTWGIKTKFERDDRHVVSTYASLSIASGLNFLPHVFLRYQIVLFSSVETLGNFAVQYQISMLAIPIITAITQQAIARARPSRLEIIEDLRLIGTIIAVLMTATVIAFLTPLSVFIEYAFNSWSPLGLLATTLISMASACLCLTVYFGFMTVALNRPHVQMRANLTYVMILATTGFIFGTLGGLNGVLIAFLVSAILRLSHLMWSVWQAA